MQDQVERVNRASRFLLDSTVDLTVAEWQLDARGSGSLRGRA
jgi:hypothetical protein